MPDETEKKGRKRVVVEEVETPVNTEVVSSKELQKEEPTPEISEEAVKTEVADESPAPVKDTPPDERLSRPDSKNSFVVWWIIIPGIFLLGALLGGIVFYQKGISKGATLTASPEPSAENPIETPSATPEAKVDLTEFSVNILNGSGIAGEAGKAKDLLTGAGFKVSGTGNASSYNFTKTVIKAKASVDSEFLTKLAETLGKNYSLDKNQTLSDSVTDDIQVVVGSTKASE
jgi:hypothetical protein